MIGKNTFTVIITTYRRFENLDSILEAWKKQPVEEVWLIDGSGQFKPKTLGIVLFSMPRDFGTRMDYSFATLTDTDFIILADDDVLPLPGFTQDLFNGWYNVKGGIVGIIGRQFKGPDYKKNTLFCASNKISSPIQTDFVGVVYFSPRKYFGFDTKGMHNNCDDLWWTAKIMRKIPKFVVPTKNYRNLATASDGGCMFHNPEYRAIRQKFYEEIYNEFYKEKKA